MSWYFSQSALGEPPPKTVAFEYRPKKRKKHPRVYIKEMCSQQGEKQKQRLKEDVLGLAHGQPGYTVMRRENGRKGAVDQIVRSGGEGFHSESR